MADPFRHNIEIIRRRGWTKYLEDLLRDARNTYRKNSSQVIRQNIATKFTVRRLTKYRDNLLCNFRQNIEVKRLKNI
jgi:hypothetical protein